MAFSVLRFCGTGPCAINVLIGVSFQPQVAVMVPVDLPINGNIIYVALLHSDLCTGPSTI